MGVKDSTDLSLLKDAGTLLMTEGHVDAGIALESALAWKGEYA